MADGLHARLVIAGDGAMANELRRQAQGLPVVFTGHLADRADLADLLAAADVAICPGPHETFGLSAIEALASGTPIVVSRNSALVNVVRVGCGLPAADTGAAFTAAVRTVLSRPSCHTAARPCAEQFTWDRAVSTMLDLHRQTAIRRLFCAINAAAHLLWRGRTMSGPRSAANRPDHRQRDRCRALRSPMTNVPNDKCHGLAVTVGQIPVTARTTNRSAIAGELSHELKRPQQNLEMERQVNAPTTGAAGTTVISARGLRRTYGSGDSAFEAVRGIDLDVQAGEVFALLGTNGAGKTSTLDLLEGLTRPSGGELEVFGLDPVTHRKQVRPLCGIMLQSGGLPAELTVRETLEMWRGTCSNPTTTDDVLSRVKLTDRADVRVRSLSGGQQRRVDLACALIGQPRLLFLDEPTTGLDPESRRSTWKLLADLKAAGVTMVLTTHYLDEAEVLADRIAIMHRGSIARLGTLNEIVDGHPAEIAFDDPGVVLPQLSGTWAGSDDGSARVTLRTTVLQEDLRGLLNWAADRNLALTGLQARHPSLESVFLAVADEAEHAVDSGSPIAPIGANQ